MAGVESPRPLHEDVGIAHAYRASEKLLTWSAKRSYRRARTLAAVHGHTTYTGVRMTQNRSMHFGSVTLARHIPPRQSYRPHRHSQDRVREMLQPQQSLKCGMARAHDLATLH